MLISLWMLTSFLLFVRSDSIMYNLSVDKEEEAMVLIKKIYHKDEDYNAILADLKL